VSTILTGEKQGEKLHAESLRQAAGRGATRLAIKRLFEAQRHKRRDFVASGGLETAAPA
jgi:hypothetical protein